ncbi:hypothetical protein D3C87_1655290 [compost metagenome]
MLTKRNVRPSYDAATHVMIRLIAKFAIHNSGFDGASGKGVRLRKGKPLIGTRYE